MKYEPTTKLEHPKKLLQSSSKRFLDFWNMSGRVPAELVSKSAKYLLRNLADTQDKEVHKIERELIRCVAHICGLDASGFVLHSGTDANELALYMARKSTGKRLVLTTNLAHVSIKDACEKLGMVHIIVDVDSTNFQVNDSRLGEIIRQYGHDIAAIVSTTGTTQLGTCESLHYHPRIKKLVKQGAWLHLDAAYGGMIFNLMPGHDTRQPLATNYTRSVAVDPYKFVSILNGSSVLLLPNQEDKKLVVRDFPYFKYDGTTLGTTHSAYPAAVTLQTMQAYGLRELQKLAADCYRKARYVASRLQEKGINTIVPVQSGVVPIALGSEEEVKYMQDGLLNKGFRVSSIKIKGKDSKGKAYQINGIRIVVTPKPEMTMGNIDRFIDATIRTYKEMKR